MVFGMKTIGLLGGMSEDPYWPKRSVHSAKITGKC